MIANLPRALIYMSGHNCAPYVTAAIESLVWQTHPHIHVLFVDDCSTDGTGTVARAMLEQYFHGRHTLVRNNERWGKARNAHVHLRAALGEGDFVAVLDADDQLVLATIVADMAAEYAAGFDVVWTNYCTDGGAVGGNGPLDPFRSPRGQGWKTSHFFSFRAELFAAVPEDRFQDELGDWLQAACDLAIAFPVLDQTRRYCFLPVQAYRYTASNPNSHHNQDPQSRGLNSRRQMRAAEVVLAKPPLPCRRWLFGDHAAADRAIWNLQQRFSAHQEASHRIAAPKLRTAANDEPLVPASRLSAEVDPWQLTAANELHSRCPGLLALALDVFEPLPPCKTLWQWWRWLQLGTSAPRVLEVGGGPLAAALHAMVRSLGGQVVSVCGSRERAMALYARLQAAGIEGDVLHLPLADAEFEGVAARFPNLPALDPELTGFDLAVVSVDQCGSTPQDAVLALPMLVSRLSSQGFRVCLWSPGRAEPLRAAHTLWRRVAPDLEFSEHALAGDALVVRAA